MAYRLPIVGYYVALAMTALGVFAGPSLFYSIGTLIGLGLIAWGFRVHLRGLGPN